MKNFLFIRHGATRGNLEKRYIGRTDEPLIGPVDRDVALPDGKNIKIYTSPRLRCIETTRLMFPEMPYTVIDGLRECDFGIFEGRTADEMSGWPEYSAWLETGCMGDIPGGDSISSFKNRCVETFTEIAGQDFDAAVIVTHGGVIMSILERLGEPALGFYDYHIPNGGFLYKRWENGKLKCLSDEKACN